jgi:hypothetical protein
MEIAIAIVIVVIAVGAVLLPLLRRDRSTPDAPAIEPDVLDEASLDAEIDRYRAAVRAGAVCDRCGQANPGGSAFCYECGRALGSRRSKRRPRPRAGRA